MDKAGKQKQCIIAILLAGAIMGMAFSAMYISKSCSFEAFYDVGNVYEEFTAGLYQGTGVVYNPESKQLEVQAEEASQYWVLPPNLEKYNYFIVELDSISQENPDVLFQFYSGENLLGEAPMQLKEGENVLEIADKTATIVYMKLYQKQGLSYGIKAVQTRERLSEWDSRTFWTASLAGFLGCVAILFLVKWIFQKKGIKFSGAAAREGLQKIFLKIAEQVNVKSFSPKVVHFGRKLLFFLLISCINLKERTGVPMKILAKDAKLYCIIILLIAFLSLEKKRMIQHQHHPLMVSWFWMAVCMSVSHFVVPKYFDLGIIYLLVFGFFFFSWANMERPAEMLQDLCVVIKWEFWLYMAYTCIFFPEQKSYVYQGAFRNPNTFAVYSLVPCCVFLAELANEKEERLTSKFIPALGLGVSVCMIWKTQCRSVLAGITLGIMVSVYAFLHRKPVHTPRWKHILQGCILLSIIFAGIFIGNAGLNTFPGRSVEQNVSDEVSLEKRKDILTLSAEAAYLPSNKLLQKITMSRSLDEFTSGRITFWRAYLRQINFWGHKYRGTVNGKQNVAHNAFLSIAYQYGALSVVPYLFYLFYYILYGYRYFKYNRGQQKYAGFPLLLILCLLPFILMDNLELPFRLEGWIVMYLTTGILFEEKTEWEKE